jgi:tetratricopeptide (TPR) repeat protein
MKGSDELFQLIRSMSKSEKRYFKLHASLQGSRKNYLELFDAIDRQKEYDEEKIRSRFAGETFLKQLNVTKHYLYELILRVLRAYHSDYTTGTQIRDLLKSADILYEKRLEDQALKLADKAIRLAEGLDSPYLLFEARRLRLRFRARSLGSEEEAIREYDRIFTTIDGIRNDLQYTLLLRRVEFHFGGETPRSQEQAAKIEEILSDPLMSGEEKALSLGARLTYNSLVSLVQFARGRNGESLVAVRRIIELIEKNGEHLFDRLDQYTSALHNRILLHRISLSIDEWERAIEELVEATRALMQDNRLQNGRAVQSLLSTLHVNRQCHALTIGAFQESTQLIRETEEWLETTRSELTPSQRVVHYHNLALLYFGRGDLRRALDYNNMILAESEPSSGRFSYYHARLLDLVIHFELGNMELLPYLLRSTYRYYRARNAIYRFESTMLDFFKKLLRVSTRPALMAAFGSLRQELLALVDDPRECSMLSCFFYLEWLQSKIEGIGFVEAVRASAPRFDVAA